MSERKRRLRGTGGLTQVKMRNRLVWRASTSFFIDRPNANGETERFRKTITGIGDTPEQAQARLAQNVEKFRSGRG